MKPVATLLVIAVIVSNRQLQADDVTPDVYNTLQADDVDPDVYNTLQADDVDPDVYTTLQADDVTNRQQQGDDVTNYVYNKQLQADNVASDVYTSNLQVDDALSDVYNSNGDVRRGQLQVGDVTNDVYREPTWCRESGGNDVTDHTECWRSNNTETRGGRKSPRLRHLAPLNVTLSKLSHFPLRRNARDSNRRSVGAEAEGTAGVARLRRPDSRSQDGHGPEEDDGSKRSDGLVSARRSFGVAVEDTDEMVLLRRADSINSGLVREDWTHQLADAEETVRLRRADGTTETLQEDWTEHLKDAEEIVRLRRADGSSELVLEDWTKQLEDAEEAVRLRRAHGKSGPVIEDWSKQLEAEEAVRLRRAHGKTGPVIEDWSMQLEDAEEAVRLRRAHGKTGPVIEDWSKQLEAEEIIRVVSCQVDMSCSPARSKACRCPRGEAGGCVVPRARVSQISRTRSGALNMFCVGVSLSHEEAGAQNPQTSCKYFSTDNAKYRVFATKVPEVDPTASGKPRIRYRACLKPMS
ncbi:Hypp862 [Branchiostoma lanceolatum]|uniref:Hypp862 protein n=1 Tax=Branchiostoma lanceolatum TaxID=7740 RepID=A0A8J9W252_BRALA|nr:Hypp862 [Branchiostoma lanceolatum]